MIVSEVGFRALLSRRLAGGSLLALAAGLSGCSSMSDGMTSAFADPAKYELYNCKQLETERKSLAARTAELQALMAKAQSGLAGPAVAELAYSNDYIAIRGQARNAEAAWVRNKCRESTAEPGAQAAKTATAPPPAATERSGHAPIRSGNAIY